MEKPVKTLTVINYKDNNWVIVPDHSTTQQVLSQLADSKRLDPTCGLFEDIYDSVLLKNMRNRNLLRSKILLRYSKYKIKIKKLSLKRAKIPSGNFQ